MINVLNHVIAGFLAAAAPQSVRFDVPIITVCEALQDRDALNGQTIVVVGRYRVTRWDGSYLDQECDNRITMGGLAWSNAISVGHWVKAQADGRWPNLPDGFRWNHELLKAKVEEVEKTTQLDTSSQLSSQQWAAIYGRFYTDTPLKTRKVGGKLTWDGVGGRCGCPASLLSAANGVRVLGDK